MLLFYVLAAALMYLLIIRTRLGMLIRPGTDGLFATSDDTFAAGKSRVGAITVQGTLDSATRFESPAFPKFAHVPNKVATAQDSRFIT